MFILRKWPPFRGTKKRTEEWQGPTLGVSFWETPRVQLQVFVLRKCPPYRETKKMTDEQQGLTLGVRFRELSVLQRYNKNDQGTKETNSRCPF